MKEIKIGDKVEIISVGAIYHRYQEAFDFYGVSGYVEEKVPTQLKPFEVVKLGKHGQENIDLVFIKNDEGTFLYDLKAVFPYETPKSTYFAPNENEEFFYLSSKGSKQPTIYRGHTEHNEIFKFQQVYKTREEAEKARKRQQAKIRVIKRIAELNEGWVPDWEEQDSDKFEKKYYIVFNFKIKVLLVAWDGRNKGTNNNLYLKTPELAEQLIYEMEADLKLMLEGE